MELQMEQYSKEDMKRSLDALVKQGIMTEAEADLILKNMRKKSAKSK